jgi:hypothetical protein
MSLSQYNLMVFTAISIYYPPISFSALRVSAFPNSICICLSNLIRPEIDLIILTRPRGLHNYDVPHLRHLCYVQLFLGTNF